MKRAVSGLSSLHLGIVAIWIGGNALLEKTTAPTPSALSQAGAPPIRLCDTLNERGTFLTTEITRFIAFVRELLPDVVPVVLGPVPPQLADKEAVQAFRVLSEWYRATAKDTNSLFVDVERTLRRAFDVQEDDEAGQCGFAVPADWVAGDVPGKPPVVCLRAPRLPEHAFNDDGVHLTSRSLKALCRELARIVEAQLHPGSTSPL